MLLVMTQNELDKNAGIILSRFYDDHELYYFTDWTVKLNGSHHSKLILVDVSDDSQIGKHKIIPEVLANKLMDLGLPESINDIYLVTNEYSSDNLLSVYAHELSRAFAQNFQRKIAVHVPSSLNFDISMVCYDKENVFQIIGINNSKKLKLPKKLTMKSVAKIEEKEIIWEGNDILKWMDDPQQVFTEVSYVWADS
jgi:hypothetical protein